MAIKKGPFSITKSREIYVNKWMRLQEDQVIRPDGSNGIFGVTYMNTGAAVLPIDDEGNIYLTKQYRYGIDSISLEAPGGNIDEGESALETVKRELKEELGISAKNWIDLGLVNPLTGILNAPVRIFIAKDLSFGDSDTEITESIELYKVRFDEALKMVMDSKIHNSYTCILILKAHLILNT